VTPQKQLFRHNPSAGVYGDCHRTVIACLLDLAPGDVPHFYNASAGEGGNLQAKRDLWLSERGLAEVAMAFEGDLDLAVLLTAMRSRVPPGMHQILGGRSRNGCNHSVLVCDGAIVWDPSLDDSGIVGPCDDGYWWVSFLARLL
jgi:hypothetical protein